MLHQQNKSMKKSHSLAAVIAGACLTITMTVLTLSTAQATTHDHKSKEAHQENVIGLQLWSLRNQMDENAAEALDHVKDWGIKDLEAGGRLAGNSIGDFRALLDERGLQIVSVDTSFEEIRDNPMGAAFKAHYFGAKYATIYWIPHDGDAGFNIDNAKEAVEILNTGGKVLAEHGITLQYHPHGYEFRQYEDGTLLDYIIQNTTEAQFQMDVFWIKQGGGSPVDILKKYAGRFTSLHLKDRLPGTPITSNGGTDMDKYNVVLGQGDTGIAEVIKEAKKQGIKYFFLEDESSRVLTQIPESLKYVRPLINDD